MLRTRQVTPDSLSEWVASPEFQWFQTVCRIKYQQHLEALEVFDFHAQPILGGRLQGAAQFFRQQASEGYADELIKELEEQLEGNEDA